MYTPTLLISHAYTKSSFLNPNVTFIHPNDGYGFFCQEGVQTPTLSIPHIYSK
jgi:hypothetical protein